MEEKLTLVKILQSDLADHIITDGRKVLMHQVSGTLRNALMSKRQSIRLKALPSSYAEEHLNLNDLEVFINSYNIVNLNVTNVWIGNGTCCQRLSEYLARCPFLTHLHLRRSRIGAEGAGRLAAGLAQCASLAHLDLGANWINADGAGRLAAALGHCASLAHLDLSQNEIGDEGVGRLAAVLGQFT